ncbi:deoxyribose-phosphate aldolase [Tenacibaculum discolor]|uniref:Deoxyribose-phosphate aldolase n=1 Tax=Tenacibaculum discolor TaxID=361581 RepID=A0A2G1BX24_9FLAO|nr:DUF6503 family protein [Tenacibaculum discolor]MDP2540576.1 deoxyribose-phosphate aldolase [Tenacibaculum discolor]PHN98538.1 deoxyribose-phosphate aldolase [Tenacibaculum discolor]
MRHLYIFLLLLMVSCKPKFTAQEIIDKSIEHSKLNEIENATISFNFRKNHYEATRDKGSFKLVRVIKNDSVTIKDILSNDAFERFVSDSLIELSKKDENRYSNSVNSVHYFSVLPIGLNDKAVQKKLLEDVTIKGKQYHKIRVTFTEEGGGEDFDDVFIYWFAKDNFQLDYLAYKYHTNGGGVRFRDVKEEKIVKGIRFVDYNNYKPLDKDVDFYTIDKLYEEGKLKKLSEIVLEDIQVDTF